MSHESDIQDLMSKCPTIYKDSKVECGFTIGPGWMPLVRSLSYVIESYVSNEAPEEIRSALYVTQVKEKFGELRIYFNKTTPFIVGAVLVAEAASRYTCEECGNLGSIRKNNNRVQTLCFSCDSTSYLLKG